MKICKKYFAFSFSFDYLCTINTFVSNYEKILGLMMLKCACLLASSLRH